MKTIKTPAVKGAKSLITFFAAFACVTVTLSSCLKNNEDEVQVAAGLSVVNTWAADSTAIDFYLDRRPVNSQPILFTQVLPYFEIFPGQRIASVVLAGTDVILYEGQGVFTGGQFYTLFFTGTADTAELVLVDDDLTAPAAGKSKVRFAHMGPDAPPVDIAVKGGAVLFSNQAYKTASDFSTVDPGSYNLEVRLAGTTTVVVDVPNVTIAADSIYTVIARGLVNGQGNLALGAQIINN